LADQPNANIDEPKAAPGEPPEDDPDALDPALPVPRGEEVLAVVEGLLFATTSPLSVERLSVLTNGVPVEEIRHAIDLLRERYAPARHGLFLMEVAGGWQIATKPEIADWVLRLHRHRKKSALSPSLLESLAIIAYKQPITRAEVEAIRGVDCGTALRALQDAGLVEIVGRKEVAGRPPLYGTTELFLKTFGLKSLEELPTAGMLQPTAPAPEAPAAPAPDTAPIPEAPPPPTTDAG
jgi:segregation and condensation protein B